MRGDKAAYSPHTGNREWYSPDFARVASTVDGCETRRGLYETSSECSVFSVKTTRNSEPGTRNCEKSLPEVSGNCRWSSWYETRPLVERLRYPDDTVKCELQRWVAGAAVGVHASACAFEFQPGVSGFSRWPGLSRPTFHPSLLTSRSGSTFRVIYKLCYTWGI